MLSELFNLEASEERNAMQQLSSGRSRSASMSPVAVVSVRFSTRPQNRPSAVTVLLWRWSKSRCPCRETNRVRYSSFKDCL